MPSYPYTPQELTDLPFNLRRAQLYPVNPPLVQQAVEDQLAGRRADAYMPQKMGFTKWHTGPARMAFGASAISAHEAQEVWASRVDGLTSYVEADKGIFTPYTASRALSHLPQPMDNFQFQANPIARGLLDRPIAQSADLTAYAQSQQDPSSAQWNTPPAVVNQTLLATALEGDMTPLGGLGGHGLGGGWGLRGGVGRGPRAREPGFFRTLGRMGMGLGALGDPLDIMSEPTYDPKANPIVIPSLVQSSTNATPTASSGTVATVTTPAVIAAPAPSSRAGCSPWSARLMVAAGVLGGALGIYHGWNRTHSTPWTAAWGVAGAVFPIVAVPVMLIQGFAKRGGH